MSETMTARDLYNQLGRLINDHHGDRPVRLIARGVAFPAPDVWFERHQDGDGAICIGDDPR